MEEPMGCTQKALDSIPDYLPRGTEKATHLNDSCFTHLKKSCWGHKERLDEIVEMAALDPLKPATDLYSKDCFFKHRPKVSICISVAEKYPPQKRGGGKFKNK